MSAFVHRHLPWDSTQLGVSTGMLELVDETAATAAALREVIPADERLTALKVPASAPQLVTALVRDGAQLIDVEHTFTFVGPAPATSHAEVRCLNTIDPGPLLDLAPEMGFSRFYRDPNIRPETAEALWRTSILNHCEGFADRLSVAFMNGQPVGLVACRDDEQARALFMVGLLPHGRGRGLGTAMIGALVADAPDRHFTVEALASNQAATALYTRSGFRLAKSHYVLHLWHD